MTHQASSADPAGLSEADAAGSAAATSAVEVTHLRKSYLSIAASFAIGLCVAAVAPTSSAARGISIAVFYPLGFFSGLYYPMFGEFPPPTPLLVLAAYALAFGFLAKRSFRWE